MWWGFGGLVFVGCGCGVGVGEGEGVGDVLWGCCVVGWFLV